MVGWLVGCLVGCLPADFFFVVVDFFLWFFYSVLDDQIVSIYVS